MYYISYYYLFVYQPYRSVFLPATPIYPGSHQPLLRMRAAVCRLPSGTYIDMLIAYILVQVVLPVEVKYQPTCTALSVTDALLRWLGLRSKHILDFCSLSAAMSSNNNTTTTTGSNPTLTNTGAVGNSSSNIITSTSSFTREHLQKLALSDTRKLTTMISALDQDRHVSLLNIIACYIDA